MVESEIVTNLLNQILLGVSQPGILEEGTALNYHFGTLKATLTPLVWVRL